MASDHTVHKLSNPVTHVYARLSLSLYTHSICFVIRYTHNETIVLYHKAELVCTHNHNKMASSKNAREIILPSYKNAPSFNSGDFSGLSTTSSASFSNTSYDLNTLDAVFSVSTGFRLPWKPK